MKLLFKTFLNYIKNFLKRLIYGERSPKKLALSFSIGIFIAFSPFIGFHNIMIFFFSWAFGLNTLTTFAIAHINNPITTIPCFSLCHMFGHWIVNDLLGVAVNFVNPYWVNYIIDKLNYYLGTPKICFWTFFIGANMLGLLLGLISYPIMKFIFKKIINENTQLA